MVIDVRVKDGQDVKAGNPLCILSAMKVSRLWGPAWVRQELNKGRWNPSYRRLFLAKSGGYWSRRMTRLRRVIWLWRLSIDGGNGCDLEGNMNVNIDANEVLVITTTVHYDDVQHT